MINPKDLVVLKYAFNECCVTVETFEEARDKHLSVDLEREVWSINNKDQLSTEIPVGQKRYLERSISNAIIGVYDRTNNKHLAAMVHAATESTRERSSWVED